MGIPENPTRIHPLEITARGVESYAGVLLDPDNGNVIENTPGLHLVFQNMDTEEAHTVTIVTPITVAGFAVEDLAIELGPRIPGQYGHTRICGNFPRSVFGRELYILTDTDQINVTAYTT